MNTLVQPGCLQTKPNHLKQVEVEEYRQITKTAVTATALQKGTKPFSSHDNITLSHSFHKGCHWFGSNESFCLNKSFCSNKHALKPLTTKLSSSDDPQRM
jgi:hypothetical protein